jgi:hypothetical protein
MNEIQFLPSYLSLKEIAQQFNATESLSDTMTNLLIPDTGPIRKSTPREQGFMVDTITRIKNATLTYSCLFSGKLMSVNSTKITNSTAILALKAAGSTATLVTDLIDKSASLVPFNSVKNMFSVEENVSKLYRLDSDSQINFLLPDIPVSGFVGASLVDLSHIHVYSSGNLSEQLSFSFGGCDSLILYELGVAHGISCMIKKQILRESKFLGSSFGAIVALALALNLDIHKVKEEVIKINEITSKR